MDVMTKDLRVMDATAIAFCRDNKIPIVVFDMSTPGSLRAILEGEQRRHDRHAESRRAGRSAPTAGGMSAARADAWLRCRA